MGNTGKMKGVPRVNSKCSPINIETLYGIVADVI